MTSESLARYHERKQDHADGFQAGWHAALQRVSEDDSVTELRDLVPDTAPAYRVERDQLAAEVERLARVASNHEFQWRYIVDGVSRTVGVTYDSPSDVVDCVRNLFADAESARAERDRLAADVALQRDRAEVAEHAMQQRSAHIDHLEAKAHRLAAEVERLRAKYEPRNPVDGLCRQHPSHEGLVEVVAREESPDA